MSISLIKISIRVLLQHPCKSIKLRVYSPAIAAIHCSCKWGDIARDRVAPIVVNTIVEGSIVVLVVRIDSVRDISMDYSRLFDKLGHVGGNRPSYLMILVGDRTDLMSLIHSVRVVRLLVMDLPGLVDIVMGRLDVADLVVHWLVDPVAVRRNYPFYWPLVVAVGSVGMDRRSSVGDSRLRVCDLVIIVVGVPSHPLRAACLVVDYS